MATYFASYHNSTLSGGSNGHVTNGRTAATRRESKKIAMMSAITDELFNECYRGGSTARLLQLIQDGADVNARDYDCKSPLKIACGLGFVHVAKVLLEHGAMIDDGELLPQRRQDDDMDDNTCFWEAFHCGFAEIVELLLSFGANPNQRNVETGETPILTACLQRKWHMVEILLNDHVTNLHETTAEEKTILHLMIEAHYPRRNDENNERRTQHQTMLLDYIRRLLVGGANPNATDGQGHTPLHLACSHRTTTDTSLVRLLVDTGHANIHAETPRGWTPLLQASQAANAQICRFLLQRGANVHQCTRHEGWTCLLLWAAAAVPDAQQNQRQDDGNDMIRTLVLEYDANVNAAQRLDQKTVLHFVAGDRGDPALTRLLLEKGANVNAETIEHVTPLQSACYHNHLGTISVLLEYGAKIDSCRRTDDITPLHVACALGHAAQVGLLIRKGRADANARALYGLTPLYYACQNGSLETVGALVANGGKVNLPCVNFDEPECPLYTVYKRMQRMEDIELFQFLLTCGARIDAPVRQEHGTTLLQLACLNNGMVSSKKHVSGGGTTAGVHASMIVYPDHSRRRSAPNTNSQQQQRSSSKSLSNVNFVDLLLDCGASRTMPNKHGWTALHFAAARGHCATMECLLRTRTLFGKATTTETTNHSASESVVGKTKGKEDNHVKNRDLLHVQTRQGSSPLHIASQLGRSYMVKLLLDRGASTRAANISGKIPLESALTGRNKTTVFLILQRMAGDRELT